MIPLRFSLHFVVGYPFIVFVSNFLKLFRLLARTQPGVCGVPGGGGCDGGGRIQYYVILGALKETLMLGFIAKARFWQPQIGLLSAEPLAGLCC